jgi:hypothetical protein
MANPYRPHLVRWVESFLVVYSDTRFTGGSDFIHGNMSKKKVSIQTLQALAWMTDYFEMFSDKMPKVNRVAVWHLSCSQNKMDIYDLYKEWCEDTASVVVSYQYFCALWTRDFSHVKIPENNRFKQCDT